MKFNIKVRNTGATKDVAGLSAKDHHDDDCRRQRPEIRAGGLTCRHTDMYLVPEIPGYEEVQEFDKRYAMKMGTVLSEAINPQMMAMMQQPNAGAGMVNMKVEISKLKRTRVLQIMRMGTTLDGTPLPAASEAPLPASPRSPKAGEIAKQSASAAIMSSIPFGRLGRKKKQEDPPPAADSTPQNSVVLIEMTMQMTNFSKGSVDAGQFDPPAGYKRVEAKHSE
jgi:hypothetical protein